GAAGGLAGLAVTVAIAGGGGHRSGCGSDNRIQLDPVVATARHGSTKARKRATDMTTAVDETGRAFRACFRVSVFPCRAVGRSWRSAPTPPAARSPGNL